MFIRTFNTPNWPSDFSVSDNIEGLDFYDNHWRCMNRLQD